MITKIMNMIKSAVNISSDDSGVIPRGQSRWYGRRSQKVEHFMPTGTFGRPVDGNAQVKLNKNCQESNVVVLNGDPANRIKKNCAKGEYGIGNNLRKSYIYFKDNGEVETKTGETTVILTSDGKISITGADSEELITIIDDWMTNMISAKVITGIGLQPFDPVTITNLTAVQTRLQKLKV